ncbi:MAG: methylenetetrahydrofolate reductase [NAD(P)H] [Egibacteraceae bacterium]
MTNVAVADLIAQQRPSFSYEFFPPRSEAGEQQLWRAIGELRPLRPTFVSVTYGAGGSTRERTLRIVARIAAETDLVPVAHLTCVGASRHELCEIIRELADAGIGNVLALRGDPPDGPSGAWQAHPDGLHHADELVALLHEEGEFSVGVAAFPELHPESSDRAADVGFLAQKCAAGAQFAVTQFFFDPQAYFDHVEAARAVGCEVPIIPGVMPVTNVRQITRFAELSGAAFPPDLAERLHAVEDDPDKVRAVGVEVATALCRDLLAGGAPGIHFYTLNRSTATREIHANLHDR